MKLCLALCIGLSVLFPFQNSFSQTRPQPIEPAPDIEGARRAGAAAGQNAGLSAGQSEGQSRGYGEGYRICEAQARQAAYQQGYNNGLPAGDRDGTLEGDRRGHRDGADNGERDGIQDGRQRADRDAFQEATPRGRQDGIDEAERSDADELGERDGLIAGDQEARDTAIRVDYPAGRRDYRDRRYAEAVQFQDAFQMKPPLAGSILKSEEQQNSATVNRMLFDFDHPEEQAAYQAAYQQAYQSFYRQAYDRAYASAYQQGCSDGRNQDFSNARQNGYQEGYRQGYSAAYDRAYRIAYRQSYDYVFARESSDTYRSEYPNFYQVHYQNARASAYRERYDQIYQHYYEQARIRKYNEMYPQYAREQFNRGVAEETADFNARPLRLLDAQATETIRNGLLEPGEEIRIQFRVRNFSDNSLRAQDLRVKIEALDNQSAIISEAEAVFNRDIRRKSITEISEALAFRFNDRAVNQQSRFRVTVWQSGRSGGENTLDLIARFMLDTRLAERPVLLEGIPTPIRFRVQNQSNQPSDAATIARFDSQSPDIEIRSREAAVGVLAAGQSKIVEFIVVGRRTAENVRVPLAVETLLGNGRRVGLVDQTETLPIMNDYQIFLDSDPVKLKQAGVSRIEYRISNRNSRIVNRSLQLLLRIQGPDAQQFQLIGPNPQYLRPIRTGETAAFVFPVLARTSQSSGVLELEVRENGRLVVIHQRAF